MTTAIERAREILVTSGDRPCMYAQTKEAFIMRAATVLEVFIDDFDVRAFYEAHLKRYGSALRGLDDLADETWSAAVTKDALKRLESHG